MTHLRPQIATFALRRLRPRDRDEEDPDVRVMMQGRGFFVVMAALIGALAAVGVIVFLVFGSQAGTASLASQRFCDALVNQDYATAYASLAQNLQRQGTEAQFAASQQALDRLRGPATACSFTNAQVQGTSATFTLRVTRQSSGTLSGTLRLVSERDAWKIAGYDASVI